MTATRPQWRRYADQLTPQALGGMTGPEAAAEFAVFMEDIEHLLDVLVSGGGGGGGSDFIWAGGPGDNTVNLVPNPDLVEVDIMPAGYDLGTTGIFIVDIVGNTGQEYIDIFAGGNVYIEAGTSHNGVLSLIGSGSDSSSSVEIYGESGIDIFAGLDNLLLDTSSGNSIKIGETVNGGDIHLGYGGGGDTTIRRDGGEVKVWTDGGHARVESGVAGGTGNTYLRSYNADVVIGAGAYVTIDSGAGADVNITGDNEVYVLASAAATLGITGSALFTATPGNAGVGGATVSLIGNNIDIEVDVGVGTGYFTIQNLPTSTPGGTDRVWRDGSGFLRIT